MRRYRKAKIIVTLGPATSDEQASTQLFEAGSDVFRMNFSHGVHADHQKRLDILRGLEQKHGRPIGVILDLQGPKLRVGDFEDGLAILKTGAAFRLDLDETLGNAARALRAARGLDWILFPGNQITCQGFGQIDISPHPGLQCQSMIFLLSPV